MRPMSTGLAFAAVFCVAVCPVAGDGMAVETFDRLYGKDVARVRGTRDTADDLKLAGDLLQAARGLGDDPDLVKLLCENAGDLAANDAGGIPVALRAMELLSEKVPAARGGCLEKIASLREKAYRTVRPEERAVAGEELMDAYLAAAETAAEGEDFPAARRWYGLASRTAAGIGSARAANVTESIKRLNDRERTVQERRQMENRVKANPGDRVARNRLIELYLVEFDRPEEAGKLLDESAGEDMRRMVPMMAKTPEALNEGECLSLAEWCLDLSAKAGPCAKAKVLARAKAAYERYLDLHKGEDALRNRARLGLVKTEKALEGADPAGETGGAWIDLLALVDAEKDGQEGAWTSDGALNCSPLKDEASAHLQVPAVVEGDYHLRTSFTVVSGEKGWVKIYLPAGGNPVSLFLGETAKIHVKEGVACDRKGLEQPLGLRQNVRYLADVRVRTADKAVEVILAVNGRKCLAWTGPLAAILPDTKVVSDPRMPVLGAHYASIRYHSVQLRMLSGKAAPLRQLKDGKLVEAHMPGKPLAKDKWVDLLAQVDEQWDCHSGNMHPGRWRREKDTLVGGYAQGLDLPVAPNGPYALKAEFTAVKLSGGGEETMIAFLLPAGSSGIPFSLRYYRTPTLMTPEGQPPWEKVGDRAIPFEAQRKYEVEATVKPEGEDVEVVVSVDGQPWIRWKGRQKDVSTTRYAYGSEWWHARRPGLTVWCPQLILHRVQFKPLSDQAVRIR